MVRGAFPNVNGAGCTKAAVLNQRATVGLLSVGSPTMLGRWLLPLVPGPKEFVLLLMATIESGNPDLKVEIPETCQPPITPSANRLPGANFFPRPTGSS